VERLNGTVKLSTTKSMLDALHVGAEEGKSFLEQLSIQQSWVEFMHKKVQVINHTPKALTKITPWEAHFPATLRKATSFTVMNEEHISILNEENAHVSNLKAFEEKCFVFE
jgi:hypothetical protein